MAIRRFECVVTRTDKYLIEIDDEIYNEKCMAEFRESFYGFTTLQEHAEHLAQLDARFPDDSFIEGYGHVRRNGIFPFSIQEAIEKGFLMVTADAINIHRIISEEIEIESKELKDERQ